MFSNTESDKTKTMDVDNSIHNINEIISILIIWRQTLWQIEVLQLCVFLIGMNMERHVAFSYFDLLSVRSRTYKSF